MTEFDKEIIERINKIKKNKHLNELSSRFMQETIIPVIVTNRFSTANLQDFVLFLFI